VQFTPTCEPPDKKLGCSTLEQAVAKAIRFDIIA
jgi:hypothetical protein